MKKLTTGIALLLGNLLNASNQAEIMDFTTVTLYSFSANSQITVNIPNETPQEDHDRIVRQAIAEAHMVHPRQIVISDPNYIINQPSSLQLISRAQLTIQYSEEEKIYNCCATPADSSVSFLLEISPKDDEDINDFHARISEAESLHDLAEMTRASSVMNSYTQIGLGGIEVFHPTWDYVAANRNATIDDIENFVYDNFVSEGDDGHSYAGSEV